MPRPVHRTKLLVLYNVWEKKITYKNKAGKEVFALSLQEAREYASRNGYSGIVAKPRKGL